MLVVPMANAGEAPGFPRPPLTLFFSERIKGPRPFHATWREHHLTSDVTHMLKAYWLGENGLLSVHEEEAKSA